MASSSYKEPTALVVISSISIGIAAIAAVWILIDIVLRRGWRSMMLIMIPVYTINALYLWPITLWTYLNYGRPSKPEKPKDDRNQQDGEEEAEMHNHLDYDCHEQQSSEMIDGRDQMQHTHCGPERPMFATVTAGVCHCGAGCVLGDIIGEWLVYGTNAGIGSPPRLLWAEYIIDFAFAFAFGIIFQYFSIAPMTGEYSPKVFIRALKADTLSLLFFEIGLFAWMAVFQIGIFGWRLEMTTVTYWWMMQIGMFIGHWTGVPINWWLITKGIKEPCV